MLPRREGKGFLPGAMKSSAWCNPPFSALSPQPFVICQGRQRSEVLGTRPFRGTSSNRSFGNECRFHSRQPTRATAEATPAQGIPSELCPRGYTACFDASRRKQ